ncbi:MAG: hypothetical protein A2283_07950 [Lentisphaerae bacterium RIFOXYA12_FULL_48_11]|nr:MAG: hypothetical protein A2283_07950 [Lentisphaerae bacterium RIFOXYA12_FULL_48_11]
MFLKLIVAIFILLVAAPFSVMAAKMSIAPDRMTVVDGRRVFILGLYETPKSDADLDRVAEAGFNLVCAGVKTQVLDRLSQRGLWAWAHTGHCIDFSKDVENREKQLITLIRQMGAHPATLVWEVPDEALWNIWWNAHLWREEQEPQQQSKLIDALTNSVLTAQLRQDMRQVRLLRHTGEYADSERLADSIWTKLGKEAPKPGYGYANAPERQAQLCSGMVAGYKKLKEIDADHPVWMNHAPRNQLTQLTAFNEGADIVGCDIYPVPFSPNVGHSDLVERSLAAVGAYTARMQQSAPGKPVWMVLQGFGWADLRTNPSEEVRRDLRRPTLQESRFMAYDSIVRGARGLLYWGTSYIEKDSQLWKDLLILGQELKLMQPVLSSHDAQINFKVTHEETAGSVERTIQVLPKQVDDKVWFLVVNEPTESLTYTIHGLDKLNGITYFEKDSGKKNTVSNGKLKFTIAGQKVHVLKPE